MSDYRFVIRAYPAGYREEFASELVGVANDLVGEGWSARQSLSLAVGGARIRARQGTNSSPREVWASGVRVALLVSVVLGSAPVLAYSMGLISAPAFRLPRYVLALAVLTIVAMTISTRWWVAVLLTAFRGAVLYVSAGIFDGPAIVGLISLISAVTMIGLAWWLAVTTDGRKAASPAVTGVLVATAMLLVGFGGAGLGSLFVPALAILYLGGLIVSRIDPRLAAAGSVLSMLFVSSIFLAAMVREETGLGYWVPIGTSIAALIVVVVATWSGTRRLVRA